MEERAFLVNYLQASSCSLLVHVFKPIIEIIPVFLVDV